jgi:cell division protein FtsI/penicillin-binding protein 2
VVLPQKKRKKQLKYSSIKLQVFAGSFMKPADSLSVFNNKNRRFLDCENFQKPQNWRFFNSQNFKRSELGLFTKSNTYSTFG